MNNNNENYRNPWIAEEQLDWRKFEAVGNYRSGLGRTFVYTNEQLSRWNREHDYLGHDESVHEADKIFTAGGKSSTPEGDMQEKFDNLLDRERQGFKGSNGQKLDRMEFDRVLEVDFYDDDFRKRPSGDRQLSSKRKSKEKRNWRRDAA